MFIFSCKNQNAKTSSTEFITLLFTILPKDSNIHVETSEIGQFCTTIKDDLAKSAFGEAFGGASAALLLQCILFGRIWVNYVKRQNFAKFLENQRFRKLFVGNAANDDPMLNMEV